MATNGLPTCHCFNVSISSHPVSSKNVHPNWLVSQSFVCHFFSGDTVQNLISSAHSHEYIHGGCACRHSQPCPFFSFPVIHHLPFLVYSSIHCQVLRRTRALSPFKSAYCRTTLPRLKHYSSPAECFGAVPPRQNHALFLFLFMKKTNTSYLLPMHGRSLNSYFRGKTALLPQ